LLPVPAVGPKSNVLPSRRSDAIVFTSLDEGPINCAVQAAALVHRVLHATRRLGTTLGTNAASPRLIETTLPLAKSGTTTQADGPLNTPVTPEVAGSSPVAPALGTDESRSGFMAFCRSLEIGDQAAAGFDRDDLAVVLPDLLEETEQ
jgi:hypothetical protein